MTSGRVAILGQKVRRLEQKVDALAAEVAQARARDAVQVDTLRGIAFIVAEVFEVDLHEVMSDRRYRPAAIARQVAMDAAADRLGYSLPRIGRFFERDHTTVLHARRAVAARRLKDPDFAARLDRLHGALDRAARPSPSSPERSIS